MALNYNNVWDGLDGSPRGEITLWSDRVHMKVEKGNWVIDDIELRDFHTGEYNTSVRKFMASLIAVP